MIVHYNQLAKDLLSKTGVLNITGLHQPYSGWVVREGGAIRPPYQFFPCNFYKLRNKRPKPSDFSFISFATLV